MIHTHLHAFVYHLLVLPGRVFISIVHIFDQIDIPKHLLQYYELHRQVLREIDVNQIVINVAHDGNVIAHAQDEVEYLVRWRGITVEW